VGYVLLGTIFNVPNRWLDAIIRLVIIVILVTVNTLALTYIERKVIARIQARLGPTRTGPAGLLQPVADALKLLTKEDLRPRLADRWAFELAPFLVFVPVFLAFIALPFAHDWGIRFLDLGLFYIIAVLAVNIVGWLMAGWSSDNKYALLGGVRAVAQMISYEIPLVVAVLCVTMVTGTLDLRAIIESQNAWPLIVYQPFPAFLFIIAMLAELNRQPFDIPVAESEVVGGVTIEYSGIRWSFFQLAEYSALFVLSLLFSALFLGGYAWPGALHAFNLSWLPAWIPQLILTFIKTSVIIIAMMWFRGTFPRLRIDQLMSLAWKVLIPLAFVQLFADGWVLVYHPFGWGLILGVISAVLLGIMAWALGTRFQQLSQRPAREERVEYVRQLMAGRSS
jgi:NADH-quinone oxidoreductase subunit H